MNPQQPYVTPPPTQAPQAPLPSNPYDFIVNPGQPPRKTGLKLGSSPAQRLLLLGGGALLLVILLVVIKGIIAPKSEAGPALVKVAQAQQELINLAAGPDSIGTGQVTLSASHKNNAATLKLVMASSQSDVLSYIGGIGYKYSADAVSGFTDSEAINELTTAASNGTYDSTYDHLVQAELQKYELALKQAYSKVGGPKGQKLMSDQYDQAQLLLQQLGSPDS